MSNKTIWTVTFKGNDMSTPIIITCLGFKTISKKKGSLLTLYGVKNITLNSKDVTELCQLKNNKLIIRRINEGQLHFNCNS